MTLTYIILFHSHVPRRELLLWFCKEAVVFCVGLFVKQGWMGFLSMPKNSSQMTYIGRVVGAFSKGSLRNRPGYWNAHIFLPVTCK